jgi:hypothetical protein
MLAPQATNNPNMKTLSQANIFRFMLFFISYPS